MSTGTTSLESVNMAYNKLSGSVPILQHLENLTKIILRDNEFDSIQAQSFSSNHTSLKIVDLSYQRCDDLTLLDHAFASLPRGTNIVLIGNTISTIPPYAFDGLSHASLDLVDLSIRELAPHAFSGTSNLTIDLRGNYITTVDPTSFPRDAVEGRSECVDLWKTRCSELSESSNSETCNRADSCLDEILIKNQDGETSALSACCAFGGGFRTGKSILMEEQSPIRCRVLNSSSDIIVCECSDETQRYDIMTSSCISSCLTGERW